VLDACAAPGGKTGHLLERMPTLSKVLAVDSDPKRMERVDSNLKRLGLNALLKVGDVTDPAVLGEELFDRILLDAPCSGSGVIRRHPDIKWLRRESDISALSERQLQMLLKLWPRVKPGGQLLYVTCSVFQEENQETIKRFIERQVDARLQANLEALIPVQCRGLGNSHGVQILPGPGQTDGFYYALLNKSL
jgi:16S rRNA (cytosine967-C5)-methyltransferase